MKAKARKSDCILYYPAHAPPTKFFLLLVVRHDANVEWEKASPLGLPRRAVHGQPVLELALGDDLRGEAALRGAVVQKDVLCARGVLD